MNQNPLFGHFRSILLYTGIWTLICLGQALVVSASGLAFPYALVDSLIFNIIMAFLLIPLWYPVRFGRGAGKNWRSRLITLSILACIIICIWLLAAYGLCYFIGPDHIDYLQFLQDSLWWRWLQGLLYYIIMVLVYYLCLYVEQLNQKADNEIHLHKLIKDGELNLLKSQINPHFLFNSMNSVNALILKNPDQAQSMLVALSDYLRYAVQSTQRVYACLADEMENIRRYLSIEQLRFGEKLQYEARIEPSCLEEKVPTMLLQPLFENAVKHGVYESLETVRILFTAKKEQGFLHLALSNNYDANGVSVKKGSGTGLQNTRERLRLLYGPEAAMQVKAEPPLFTVEIKIALPSQNTDD